MHKKVRRSRKERSENVPRVGIFFAVDAKLWVDSTPLTGAGIYGDFKIHELGHDEYWAQLIATGAVPPDSEYEEYPRGRVAFNERTEQFSLLADRCILRDKKKVADIMERLHLPAASTTMGTDPHYRCPECLGKEE
jgi:hypothetical protein